MTNLLKTRDEKENYILKQMHHTELNERIEVLKMIIAGVGLVNVQVISSGTIVHFEKINDELLDELYLFLLDSEQRNTIDFSDVL